MVYFSYISYIFLTQIQRLVRNLCPDPDFYSDIIITIIHLGGPTITIDIFYNPTKNIYPLIFILAGFLTSTNNKLSKWFGFHNGAVGPGKVNLETKVG